MAGIGKEHKKVLDQLAQLIAMEEDCVTLIYTDKNIAKDKIETLEITRSKTGEEFKVLVIGAFSSGKSSMINALVGEELLPTGFLPETAVLGELHYSDDKRITLYPKKGKWEGGDAPFDLVENTPEEIAKYVSLSADDALNAMEEDSENHIDAKFEKMVIRWPLEILRDGVVLIDSPGINDPYSNDYIVNAYLPRADAIIYLMDAQHAYQNTDVNQLFVINDTMGIRNIVTGYTFYDIVLKQNAKKPAALERLRNTLISHAKKHSDLGEPAIHFLSSMEALDAKLNNDPEGIRRSGYEGLESYLSQYLAEGKGRDQVRNMAVTIVKQADIMMKNAEDNNNAANQDVGELKKNADRARRELQTVKNNSKNTGRNYRAHLENYIPKVRAMTESCIYNLAEDIDLEGFEPETQLPDGPRKLWPFGENGARKRAKDIQAECQRELERRLNIKYQKWSNNTLNPYLKDAVKESTNAIRPDLEQISRDLQDVVSMVSGEAGAGNGDISNIALGVAYAIITGDWFTGGMSAIYGKGAMVRGIAFQAAAGVVLGVLFVAGAPITLPVVAVAAIGASIASILTGNNKKKVEKIKSQAASDLRSTYKKPEAKEALDAKVDAVMENVKSYIESACSDMENALAADIKSTEDNIRQMIDASEMGTAEKENQIRMRKEAIIKLKDIQKDTMNLCQKYGITSDEINFSAGSQQRGGICG